MKELPFPVGDVARLIYVYFYEPPPQPSLHRACVPAALDAAIARGMAKDPEQHYASAGELANHAHAAISAPEVRRSAAVGGRVLVGQ